MLKYLVHHKVGGNTFWNAFIIPNHYNHSLEAFMILFNELKKTFKGVSPDDVDCRTVVKSSFVQKQPAIRVTLKSPPTPFQQKGWRVVEGNLPDIIIG